MKHYILLSVVLISVFVGAFGNNRRYESCSEREDLCEGEGLSCVIGRCRCAPGYIYPHPHDGSCVPCPGYGEMCWGQCCSSPHGKLDCWQGTCQKCHDQNGNWICSDQINSVMLISATQIAMGTALVLGILATFVLLYKLCAAPDVRAFGSQTPSSGRLSVGSMQLYVDERLRDAPPRYSRATPAGGVPPVFPLHGYLNAGFIHDSSVPPPAYSGPHKDDEPANPAVHM